jgi:NAD(P)-dependent dehydrogenase (short-subunit alcohol dehydrogenase family)
MKLQNKIAVIAGGNSGIGLATAQEFIEGEVRAALLRTIPQQGFKCIDIDFMDAVDMPVS